MIDPGHVRDRAVVALMLAVVATALGASLASALIPGLDGLLASVPVLVVVLVVGTAVVLVWSVGRGRGA